jgi:hypothetical protein
MAGGTGCLSGTGSGSEWRQLHHGGQNPSLGKDGAGGGGKNKYS